MHNSESYTLFYVDCVCLAYEILAVHTPAYVARLLAPAALGPLCLPPASCEFSDGARHPFAGA